MNPHKTILITLLTIAGASAHSQEVLSLDECHRRALEANASLKRTELKQEEADAMEKVALWQMLPKVSANGVYNWSDRNINLLSDEQKDRLNTIGNSVQDGIGSALQQEFSDLPLGGEWIANRLTNLIAGDEFVGTINGVGERIVESMETDTRNIAVGMVTLTQPVFMGGKLMAMHRTAMLARELAGIEVEKAKEDLIVEVDKAYWQVVSLVQKKTLAEQYAALLDTLTKDVEEMVAAEVATRGDLTKVKVKRNEAQMKLTKATNGLRLAKMLLAERCGMALDSDFEVAPLSSAYDNPSADNSIPHAIMDTVWAQRKEMRMLRMSDSIAQQGVTIARSTLLPNVVATGGYLVSNPNLFNGVANEFGGTFFAGVAVNVPLLHPGAFYTLRAAKAKRAEVQWQMKEAREMIELQVSKVRFELELAYKKRAEAASDLDNAEENLRLAEESFKAGMASSSDLMAAQTAWLQAKSEVLDAEIEIELGRVYLKQAMGE